jgi:hypothetical protein
MSEYAAEFWRETERYHDMAAEYEQHVETTHPSVVTGRTGCGFCYHCGWCATAVTYREYRGPRPSAL